MKLSLPQYNDGIGAATSALYFILHDDQYDDWLSDPIYFRDLIDSVPEVANKLQAQWAMGNINAPEFEQVQLPRASKSPLFARSLPLRARLAAHVIISKMAERISPAIRRDKIYGFRWLTPASRDDVSRFWVTKLTRTFDSPGGELPRLFRAIVDATLAVENKTFGIVDVAGFNASIRASALSEIIVGLGARSDEASSLLELVSLGDSGVASIDDAFAFVYNFYLTPVDEQLFKLKLNFFRYRDEYYVLDKVSRDAVIFGLSSIGLAYSTSEPIHISTSTPTHVSRGQEPEVEMLRLGSTVLLGRAECFKLDEHCSDWNEMVAYQRDPDFTLMPTAFGDNPDAVRLLPYLRSINRNRYLYISELLGFQKISPNASLYLNRLGKISSWLRTVLLTSAAQKRWWHVNWSSALLADAGETSGEVASALQRVVHSAEAALSTRCACQLALVRMKLPNLRDYLHPLNLKSEYGMRTHMVACSLAARSQPTLWTGAKLTNGGRDPHLIQFLEMNMRRKA